MFVSCSSPDYVVVPIHIRTEPAGENSNTAAVFVAIIRDWKFWNPFCCASNNLFKLVDIYVAIRKIGNR